MLEIMQHTPIWVYILFFLLLYLSIKSCFPHEIKTWQAIILPLLFFLLSLQTFSHYPHPMQNIPLWLTGMLAGLLLARYLSQNNPCRLGKHKHTLVVPGSYAMLIIFPIYFAIRYYLGYQEAAHGGVQGLTIIQRIVFFCSSGFTCGFFGMRAWLLIRCYARLMKSVKILSTNNITLKAWDNGLYGK